MFLAVADGSITEIPPSPGSARASSSPAHPEQASCSSRPTSGGTARAAASTTPSAPDGGSSPTARLPSTAPPQWFASIGGAVFAVGGESGLTDVDGAYAR
jgi:hypothetical protein